MSLRRLMLFVFVFCITVALLPSIASARTAATGLSPGLTGPQLRTIAAAAPCPTCGGVGRLICPACGGWHLLHNRLRRIHGALAVQRLSDDRVDRVLHVPGHRPGSRCPIPCDEPDEHGVLGDRGGRQPLVAGAHGAPFRLRGVVDSDQRARGVGSGVVQLGHILCLAADCGTGAGHVHHKRLGGDVEQRR
jgi:hypothetical protein